MKLRHKLFVSALFVWLTGVPAVMFYHMIALEGWELMEKGALSILTLCYLSFAAGVATMHALQNIK